MEVQGKVIAILAEEGGEGKNGPWKKQCFVIETDDKYPKKVAFDLWNDKIDEFKIVEGESVTVSINIESREYNGRWFTNVTGWKVESEPGF
tara:strand:- start:70 stop:342 length:273 start_codon:yes stop_codon:yes gene_type:complete